MSPMMNALMPGEHNYQQGKPMPGQVPPAAPQQMQPAQQMMQPAQSDPAKRGGFLGGVGNALGAIMKFGAPEAYEQGRQQKLNRNLGNALAEGNYEQGAQEQLRAGNIEQGLAAREMGQAQSAEQRKAEAQGVLQLFTTLQPEQVTQYATEDPAGFERMTGMSSDEYMQAGARMQQMGIPPAKFAEMVVSKAQAELGMTPQGPAEGKVVNNRLVDPITGEVRGDFSDAPKRETQADALGRLRYVDTGEIVPGYEDAKPNKPLVQVNTGDMGAGDRPIVDKPPKGYQRVWDGEGRTYRDIPIPGSDGERDEAAMNLKATQRLAAEGEQFQTMVGNIDDAISMVNNTSAGFGAMTSGVPTSPARNLKAKLDTVQALIGFDKLNEMRQTSPTGGALGNVTERELEFLQSVRGSLDTGQSPEQLKQTLEEVKQSLSRLQEVREIAFRMENGLLEPGQEKPRVTTAPVDPAEVEDLVNKYLGGAQ